MKSLLNVQKASAALTAATVSVPQIPLLNLGHYCRERSPTPQFANTLKDQLLARTIRASQLLEQAEVPYADHTRQAHWQHLISVCKDEVCAAASLPVVDSAETKERFLDQLVSMQSRSNVLSILMNLLEPCTSWSGQSSSVHQQLHHHVSSSTSPTPPLQSSESSCTTDGGRQRLSDAWMSRFLSERIKWHILQQDFIHLCDGGAAIVDNNCDVLDICESAAVIVSDMCMGELGVAPKIEIDADCDTLNVCGVSEQFRYMVTEILKNAAVATIESAHPNVPIAVRIRHGEGSLNASEECSDDLHFRIEVEDGAGGVPPFAIHRMWSFGFSTHQAQPMHIAGFGVGLPLARVYANLFGGVVSAVPSLHSTHKVPGTTFTVRHPCVGRETKN